MLSKKKTEGKGKCPFRGLKDCSSDCAFYRKGIRYTDDQKSEPFPFEECAINIIADNVEAIHNRSYMLQKEVGETKNVIAVKILSDLGMAQPSEVQRQAMKIIKPTDEQRQVLIDDKKKSKDIDGLTKLDK